MPSVGGLRSRITGITDELSVIINDITTLSKGTKDLTMQKEIQEFKEQESAYDTQFVEEESKRAGFGGKSRKQSLQEFVLLFFYVAASLLTCALVLYSFTNGDAVTAVKLFLVMCFAILVITALIIRYA